MFREFEDKTITIDTAREYQEFNYYRTLIDGSRDINYRFIKAKRKAMLEHLTGGSEEEFNNRLFLDSVGEIEDEDGFIYTTNDGRTITCTGSIRAKASGSLISLICVPAYEALCIADEIAPDAFAVDFDLANPAPCTFFERLTAPFCKKIGKGAFKHQYVLNEGKVYAKHTPKEEIERAFALIDIRHKVLLNIKEASEYFGLSEKSLYGFAREHPESHTLLHVGNRIRIKRQAFEDLLTTETDWVYGL